MKTKKASSQSPSPAQKKQKTSQGTEVRVDNKAKGTPLEYDPNNPLVSLPPDALTAVLCRSPSSDHDALWRSCKTIRSTLNSAAFTSERVTTGYAEVSVRHVSGEELWYDEYGEDEEHDPASEEYNAEKSARKKEEQMEGMSDLGYCDETFGYHDIDFQVMVDGRCRGSIQLVLFPSRGLSFLEAADAYSQELQDVSYTLCDRWGRPKPKSIKDADSDRTAGRGGFLHVVRVAVFNACRPSDNTDVPSKALHMAITHPKLQNKWTLATGIADSGVYHLTADTKFSGWREGDTVTVEKEAAEREKSRKWDELMLLDSKTYLRVGYQQIPEVLGSGNQANWFFALPRFLNDVILSEAEASKGLLEGPDLPPEPKGANKKLRDFLIEDSYRHSVSVCVQKVKSLIIDNGASIRKASVLHCAAYFRLNDLFEELFELVPDNERTAAINDVDFRGYTPLMIAAQSVGQGSEQYDFAEKLITLGADKNFVDFRGFTALGIYRTNLQSSFGLLFNPYDDENWGPIRKRMEDLLMPTRGETEADRNAKESPASDYDWDEDGEDSEEEDDGEEQNDDAELGGEEEQNDDEGSGEEEEQGDDEESGGEEGAEDDESSDGEDFI